MESAGKHKAKEYNTEKCKRLFIAINLSEEVCDYFYDISSKLSKHHKEIKPVPSQNIHITLKFLGNIKENEIKQICHNVGKFLKEIKSFKFEINGLLDSFPRLSASRILYGVIGKGSGEIENLYYKIEKSLSELGTRKEEKKFIPHITIARMKMPVNLTEFPANLNLKEFKNNVCSKVVLYESILSGDIPKYRVEREFLLK
ncbi:MAG: RNA 2',3'-cyclic phosphodiesterase [Actinobacteria bacterium]|nr:RNA 2',3'-cyclic phosphodiesterase [Actinomycetota bacterium]